MWSPWGHVRCLLPIPDLGLLGWQLIFRVKSEQGLHRVLTYCDAMLGV